MAERTIQDLRQKQALPLNVKLLMTKQRIRDWVNEFGEDGVYISFSGGKDSTVLLDIVRSMYPSIPAVFVDTGLEYPEIREFVKSFENVVWLKPKKTFKQVIEEYGYPFISKEVSNCVKGASKYLKLLVDRQTYRQTDRQTESFLIRTITEDLSELASTVNKDLGNVQGSPRRLALLFGILTNGNKASSPNNDRSFYSYEKYKFLLDSPYNISDDCCHIMKRNPINEYERKTKRKAIIGVMAEESFIRTQKWIQNGCNGFGMKRQESNPIAFWTEQDVLLYIKQNNLPICSVYGYIVEDTEIDGQMSLFDYIDADAPKLKTTGCKRTGCMFCGYGCHLGNDDRFVRMKHTHPKQYDYIMRPKEQGGLDYKNVIDWLNENGNLKIKY